MATETHSSQNILLCLKKQSAAGTPATITDPATNSVDVVLVTDANLNPGAQFEPNEEKVGSVDRSLPELTRIQPQIAGASHIFRGTGDITTEAMLEKILTCGGWELLDHSATFLPSTGTTTAASGTTSTIVIDASVDTDWDLTDAELVDEVLGSMFTLSVNPSSATAVCCVAVSRVGDNVTLTFDRTFSTALDSSTEIVRIAERKLVPQAAPDGIGGTVRCWRDGKRFDLVDYITAPVLNWQNAAKVTCDVGGQGSDGATPETDETTPTFEPDYTLIAAKWKKGRLSVLVGSTVTQLGGYTMQINTGNQNQEPGDPNADEGWGNPQVPRREIEVSLRLLEVLKATVDFRGLLKAETVIALHAHTNISQAASMRLACTVPTLKLLDATQGAEGNFITNEIRGAVGKGHSSVILSIF